MGRLLWGRPIIFCSYQFGFLFLFAFPALATWNLFAPGILVRADIIFERLHVDDARAATLISITQAREANLAVPNKAVEPAATNPIALTGNIQFQPGWCCPYALGDFLFE